MPSLKFRDGSSWVIPKRISFWNGSQWVAKSHLKFWNGSQWAIVGFGSNVFISSIPGIKKVGSHGSPVWEINNLNLYPGGCDVDPEGNSYVVNMDRVVRKINPNGSISWAATIPSGEDFNNVVVDKNRDIYVTSSEFAYLAKVSSSGSFVYINSLGVREEAVLDADVNTNKILCLATWDSEDGDSYLIWFNTDTRSRNNIISFASGSSKYFTSLAIDQNGYIYSSTSVGDIYKHNANYQLVWQIVHSGDIRDIEVDKSGNIYLGYSIPERFIRKINPSGSIIWTSTNGNGYLIEIDPYGNIYVRHINASGSATILRKLNSNGNLIWEYDNGDVFYGIAVEPGKLGAFPDKWT